MNKVFESFSGAISKATATFGKLSNAIRYGLNADVKIELHSRSVEDGFRKNAFFGNDATPIGRVNCEIVQDYDDFSGYNTLVLDTNGHLDPEAFAALIKSHFDTDRALLKYGTIMTVDGCRDNCVGVIYNLLRLYYITENSKLAVDGAHAYYNNGHIHATVQDLFGVGRAGSKITDITFRQARLKQFDPTFYIGAGLEEVVVNMSITDPTSLSLLAMAIGEWATHNVYALAHSSPVLTQQTVAIRTHQPVETVDIELRDVTCVDVAKVLVDFVNSNRLHSQFEMAYAMLAQVMLNIKPRSAEALIWLSTAPVMRLPLFRTQRGIHMAMTSGNPYTPIPERLDAFASWLKNRDLIKYHSLALCEATMAAAFEITSTGSMHEILQQHINRNLTSNSGLALDLLLCSTLYGKEIELGHLTSAGLDRFSWISAISSEILINVTVDDPNAYDHYRIERNAAEPDSIHVKLRASDFVPYVFPVNSFGINPSTYYQNALHHEVTLKADHYTDSLIANDGAEFVTAMNVLRIAGYDAYGVKDNSDGKQIHNWADNASGRFLYARKPDDEDETKFRIPAQSLSKRNYSWISMPSVAGTIKMSYNMTIRKFTMFKDGKQFDSFSRPLEFYKFGAIRTYDTDMAGTLAKIVIKPRPHVRTDFRVATIANQTVVRPHMIVTTGVIQAPATEEEAPDESEMTQL